MVSLVIIELFLSIYLSISLSLSIYLYIYLSISLSIYKGIFTPNTQTALRYVNIQKERWESYLLINTSTHNVHTCTIYTYRYDNIYTYVFHTHLHTHNKQYNSKPELIIIIITRYIYYNSDI